MRHPSPSFMKTGVPPTPLNDRTGELTPPGISCFARAKAASELAIDRVVAVGMFVFPGECVRSQGILRVGNVFPGDASDRRASYGPAIHLSNQPHR